MTEVNCAMDAFASFYKKVNKCRSLSRLHEQGVKSRTNQNKGELVNPSHLLFCGLGPRLQPRNWSNLEKHRTSQKK